MKIRQEQMLHAGAEEVGKEGGGAGGPGQERGGDVTLAEGWRAFLTVWTGS